MYNRSDLCMRPTLKHGEMEELGLNINESFRESKAKCYRS